MADTVNKVEVNGETIIDLSNDTVTAETLDEGVTAHDATGASITGTRTKTYAWDDITDKPFTEQSSDTLEWNGTDYIEEWSDLYKVSDSAPPLDAGDITGQIIITSASGSYTKTLTFPSDDVTTSQGSTYFDLIYNGYPLVHITKYPYTDPSDGIYLGKGTFEFAELVAEEGYVSSITIDGAEIGTKEVINKTSLPDDVLFFANKGTAGQFAVSDGTGGITWLSLTNVAEEGA